IARDVSGRHASERDLRRTAAVVHSSEEAIFTTDLDGIVTSWNRAAEALYGYPAEAVLGRPAGLLAAPEREGDERRVLQRVALGGTTAGSEPGGLASDGRSLGVALPLAPFPGEDDAPGGVSVIARDISEQKRVERELRYHAEHDGLTGLYNRRRFEAA